MVTVINGIDCESAWELAAVRLLETPGGEIQDLVVSIENCALSERAKGHRFNPTKGGGDNLSNVANTIFPQRIWERTQDRTQLYADYLKANSRSHHGRWGTYFERLISFGDERINQLENAISVIKRWQKSPKSAICFHTSSPALDVLKPLGSPCLQAIQLHCHSKRLDASVFYRNHDYLNKALGNFIGLGRLIAFIAGETGRSPGSLVSYSTHAYFEGTKTSVRKILAP